MTALHKHFPSPPSAHLFFPIFVTWWWWWWWSLVSIVSMRLHRASSLFPLLFAKQTSQWELGGLRRKTKLDKKRSSENWKIVATRWPEWDARLAHAVSPSFVVGSPPSRGFTHQVSLLTEDLSSLRSCSARVFCPQVSAGFNHSKTNILLLLKRAAVSLTRFRFEVQSLWRLAVAMLWNSASFVQSSDANLKLLEVFVFGVCFYFWAFYSRKKILLERHPSPFSFYWFRGLVIF